jgi:hypothetical protein
LADGGTLAFGLRHVYPIEESLEHIYGVLKGSDAVVYQSIFALGYEAMLYLYYQDEIHSGEGVFMDKVLDFSEVGPYKYTDLESILLEEGGILANDEFRTTFRPSPYDEQADSEQVEWVTPVTGFNCHESVYMYDFGSQARLVKPRGDVCLIVRVGKAGDRWRI